MSSVRFRRRSSWSSSSDKEKEFVIKLWFASILAMFGINGWMLYHGMWDELWKIVWGNTLIWFALISTWLYFLYWRRTHENFSQGEFWFSCAVTPFFVYTSTAVGYFFFTDIGDTEIYNGHAQRAEYIERYYTTSTDKDGNQEKTYHGPYYHLYTSNRMTNGAEEYIDISSSSYERFVDHWGRSRVTSKVNHSASNLAYIYEITWDGDLQHRVPTAVSHYTVNYVKGSHSILKTHGAMSGYKERLLTYPKVHDGPIAPVCLDRVLQAGVAAPPDFIQAVNTTLTDALCTMGARKQVNILVYLVDADVGFANALREYWCNGKKNDVIVVIGTDGTLSIRWVDVLAWTDHFEFIEALKDNVRAHATLNGKGAEVAQTILSQIDESGPRGFLRKPMKDFESNIADVSMPLWGTALLLLLIAVLTAPTVLLCIHD